MGRKTIGLLLLLLAVVLVGSGCGPKSAKGGEHGGHAGGNAAHGGHAGETGETAAKFVTAWKLTPERPKPNEPARISLQIRDAQGKPVEKFDVSHEKTMHWIIISKDLSYFDHLHPDYKGNGIFETETKLPGGGEYKLIADFIPTGAAQRTETTWIRAEGADLANPIQPDRSLAKSVSGIRATLSFDSLQAGRELQMTFSFKDEASGKPVTNLQPYLGAVGHVVIVSADAEQYIHNHPVDERTAGPDAKFATTFPKSGVYKIWGQFQRDNKTFIVPFVVRVP